MEKVEFSIAVERSGVADLPELCRCISADAAGGVIHSLLRSEDRRLIAIHVSVIRLPG